MRAFFGNMNLAALGANRDRNQRWQTQLCADLWIFGIVAIVSNSIGHSARNAYSVTDNLPTPAFFWKAPVGFQDTFSQIGNSYHCFPILVCGMRYKS